MSSRIVMYVFSLQCSMREHTREFFDQSQAKKKELSAEYVNNQKTLDAALMPALNAEMKAYLATSFSLKDGDRPHLMKF
eukprot:358778-Pelagomonas_calceolata.AAC.5